MKKPDPTRVCKDRVNTTYCVFVFYIPLYIVAEHKMSTKKIPGKFISSWELLYEKKIFLSELLTQAFRVVQQYLHRACLLLLHILT